MLHSDRLKELARLSEGREGEIVDSGALADWDPEEIADAEREGLLVLRGFGRSVRCEGCHKGCTVEPSRVQYPDGRNVGVWICRDPEDGGRIEFEMEKLRYWEIMPEKLRGRGYLSREQSNDEWAWEQTVRLEAKACASRRELEAERVTRIFRKLDEMQWHTPKFPWSTAFDEAIVVLGPRKALALFEGGDLVKLRERCSLVEYFNDWLTPFYTLDELAEVLGLFATSLEDNRGSLLASGYPRKSFGRSYWLDRALNRLLYTKVPLFNAVAYLFQAGFSDPRGWDEERMNMEGYTQIKRNGEGDFEYDYVWAENPEDEGYKGVNIGGGTLFMPAGFYSDEEGRGCCYEKANRLAGLSEEDARRVEVLRPKFLDTKIEMLRVLAGIVGSKEHWRLWDECLCVFGEKLSAEDTKFLLELEKLYADIGAGGTYARSKTAPSWVYMSGGLSDLLDVIGSCEKELRFGSLQKTKEAFLAVPQTLVGEGITSYYHVIGESWQGQVEQALEKFKLWESEERGFWIEYQGRVREALKSGLGGKVRVSIDVWIDAKHRAVYEPNVRTFAEFQKAQVETTGRPASLRLQTDQERGGSDAEIEEQGRGLANVFRKRGDRWEVRFNGGTVFHVDELKGMKYIAELLAKPGVPIASVHLANPLADGELRRRAEICEDNDVNTGGREPEEVAGKEALRKCRERLAGIEAELRKARSDNNVAEVERVEKEKEKVLEYVRQATGLGGRAREFRTDVEKARKAVGNAITKAIRRIEKGAPGLARHLDKAIDKGIYCTYQPEVTVEWDLG